MDVWDACISALTTVYSWIRTYAYVQYYRLSLLGGRATRKTDVEEWKIYKVLVFCEDDGAVNDVDFDDITQWFSAEHWEEDVADAFPEWKKWKLEIRYRHRGEKFRRVIRNGCKVEWPPLDLVSSDRDSKPKLHALHKPTGVLAATLVPHPDSGGNEVDITHRVKKYAGVSRDFSGAEDVRAHDLFPLDDNEWSAQRFGEIRIIRAHPIKFVTADAINYAANGLIVQKKND